MRPLVAQADATMLPLPDESVDLIVTSPPYFALRAYRDGDGSMAGQIGLEDTPREYVQRLWQATAEWWRVLRPTGSLFVNLGDKYAGSGGHNNGGIAKIDNYRRAWDDGEVMAAAHASRRNGPDRYNKATEFAPAKSLLGLPWLYALGCVGMWPFERGMAGPEAWVLRAEIIWHKLNHTPESVMDRVHRSHETWFHLVKSRHYYSNVDELREPYAPGTERRYRYGYDERAHDLQRPTVRTNLGGDTYEQNPLGRMPGSVWSMASEPLRIPDAVQAHYDLPQHFAAFPTEWPRRLILGWTPPGYCTVCGQARHRIRGRDCPSCGELVPTQHNGCSSCGHVRDWKQGRQLSEDLLATDFSHNGAATPRLPGGFADRTRLGDYRCGCALPSAPTKPAVVLDPFGGSGTTAGVARQLGRVGISVDLSRSYCRLARWRIESSGHFAKAATRTDQERQGTLL